MLPKRICSLRFWQLGSPGQQIKGKMLENRN